MYPELMVIPMREELVRAGIEETRTADEVDTAVTQPGTTLLVVNSICGCAAGKMRPGVRLALANAANQSLTGLPANIVQCCQVGLWGRDIFAKLKLKIFAKIRLEGSANNVPPILLSPTTRRNPLPTSWPGCCRRQHPQLVVSDMKKSLRTNKVLVDGSQSWTTPRRAARARGAS